MASTRIACADDVSVSRTCLRPKFLGRLTWHMPFAMSANDPPKRAARCTRAGFAARLDRAVDAAVDDNGLAGEIAGLRRTEIGAEIADFVRLSQAAHRNGFGQA